MIQPVWLTIAAHFVFCLRGERKGIFVINAVHGQSRPDHRHAERWRHRGLVTAAKSSAGSVVAGPRVYALLFLGMDAQLAGLSAGCFGGDRRSDAWFEKSCNSQFGV